MTTSSLAPERLICTSQPISDLGYPCHAERRLFARPLPECSHALRSASIRCSQGHQPQRVPVATYVAANWTCGLALHVAWPSRL